MTDPELDPTEVVDNNPEPDVDPDEEEDCREPELDPVEELENLEP